MKVGKNLSHTSKVKEASLRSQPFDLKENTFLILLLMEKIRQTHQLKLVVYLIIYRVFYIPGFLPSTVSWWILQIVIVILDNEKYVSELKVRNKVFFVVGD